MNDYASRELSQELYEATGWTADWGYDTSYADNWLRHVAEFPPDSREAKWVNMIPAYSIGYLLNKLPGDNIHLERFSGRDWLAIATFVRDGGVTAEKSERTNTPADALASLALELHKRGLLS